MSCCAHCRAIDDKFSRKRAEADRRRYRRHGPDDTTAKILGMLRQRQPRDATLLDVGGGIGVLAHELVGRGARSAVLVEASAAYLAAAGAEAKSAGKGERLRVVHGDFVALAGDLPHADIVTLDRVVCCYPDYRTLIGAAAAKSRGLLALSYPRERWLVRLFIALQNFGRWLMRDPFRTFVHPPAEIHRMLARGGMSLADSRESRVWRVVLYTREPPVTD